MSKKPPNKKNSKKQPPSMSANMQITEQSSKDITG